VLGLQPTATLDYPNVDTGEWLANCAACCVPEIAGAFTRARIPYDTVAGTIEDDERAWARIGAWVRAAGVAHSLRRSRIGFLGHVYPGMLDMYADFTMVHAQVGAHVEVLEIDDLASRVESATAQEVATKEAEIRATFDFADPSGDPIAGPIEPEELEWSSRVAVGLDRLAADFDLQALTYYHRGAGGNESERLAAGLIVGNSLLTARGIPTSGEGDLKTNVAQLILDRLRAGGSFTEYYALDFEEGFMLMGHDGPKYRARHRDVWPEMLAALSETGWRNYSLFLDDDGLLVGYLETDDFKAALRGMEVTDVNARWQAEMTEFFELGSGERPDTGLRRLDEIFHLQ
jgi:L-arabinose isomerase